MKTLLTAVIWLSIGLGVSVAYTERHHKKMPEDTSGTLLISLMWPALIAADVYRALASAKSDSCTVAFDG